MGQTIITPKTGGYTYFNTGHIRTSDKTMFIGNYGSGNNSDHSVYRAGFAFSGFDISNKKVTGITLSLYCTKHTYTSPHTYRAVISNTIDYNNYTNAKTLCDVVGSDEITTKQTGIALNTLAIGETSIELNYISCFSSVNFSNDFYLYLVPDNADNVYNINSTQQVVFNVQSGSTQIVPTLTIDWEYLASDFTCNSVATVGENYQISITAYNTAYSHKAFFYVNNESSPCITWDDIAAGITQKTKTIDTSIASKFSSSQTLPGKIILKTYNVTEEIGQKEKNITFSLNNADNATMPDGEIELTGIPSGAAYINNTMWTCKLTMYASKIANSSIKITSWTLYRVKIKKNTVTDEDEIETREIIQARTGISTDKIIGISVNCSSVSDAGVYKWLLEITNSLNIIRTVTTNEVTVAKTQAYQSAIVFEDVGIYRTNSSGIPAAEGTFYKLSGSVKTTREITYLKVDGTVITAAKNKTNFNLNDINHTFIGNNSLTTTKNVVIEVSTGKETKSTTVILQSANYMLYFKKGGEALGIGKAVEWGKNLVDVGWNMVISKSVIEGDTEADMLSLRRMSDSSDNYIKFQYNTGSYITSLWGVGYDTNKHFVISNESNNIQILQAEQVSQVEQIGSTKIRSIDLMMEIEVAKKDLNGNITRQPQFLFKRMTGNTADATLTLSFPTVNNTIVSDTILTKKLADNLYAASSTFANYLTISAASSTYFEKNKIIYSSTAPTTVTPGAIWLQPI